ncbi:MAG: hypothetical protein C5B59_16390 [Bacteroidetes bacterium]|nr:MAG: hypothetical protein C5B59_16390 [Bacteroidota bacterium]
MKKTLLFLLTTCILSSILLYPTACMKDRITHTYTMYIPVYKSLSSIRASIKSTTPVEVKSTGKIYLWGKYIFLNEREKGIHIIDNSNPSSPQIIAFLNIPGNENISIKDATLFADSFGDLVTFDVRDPSHPVYKKSIWNIFPSRYSSYSATLNPDSVLLLVDLIVKDTTVNYTYNPPVIFTVPNCLNCGIGVNMGVPTYAAASNVTNTGIAGSTSSFATVNDRLYTVDGFQMQIFNIQDPLDPSLANKVQLNWNVETVFPFEDKLFLGTTNGVYAFDIKSSPDQPVSLGQFAHARACDPVIVDNQYAFVTLTTGSSCGGAQDELDILNISNDSQFSWNLVKTYPMFHPHGLAKDGKTLFICDDTQGLKIYDASDVNNLKMIQQINLPKTYDVITTNGLALVATTSGLYQFDYHDLSNIHHLSKL